MTEQQRQMLITKHDWYVECYNAARTGAEEEEFYQQIALIEYLLFYGQPQPDTEALTDD